MKTDRIILSLFWATLSVWLLTGTVAAQQIVVTEKKRVVFQKKEIEPSALEPMCGGKYLLVADDKRADLLVVNANTGDTAADSIKIPMLRLERQPTAEFLSGVPDWEGMARDKANNYYLMSSHKAPGYSYVLRFKLKVDCRAASFQIVNPEQFHFEPSFESLRSRFTNADIEGLAVMETAGQRSLIIGIRERWSDVIRVYYAAFPSKGNSLRLDTLFHFRPEETLKRPRSAQWHLSSIEAVPGSGFLIVTTTENGNDFEGNAIWFVSQGYLARERLTNRDPFVKPASSGVLWPGIKVEGLAILSVTNPRLIEAAIAFDNDFGQGTDKASEIRLARIGLGNRK